MVFGPIYGVDVARIGKAGDAGITVKVLSPHCDEYLWVNVSRQRVMFSKPYQWADTVKAEETLVQPTTTPVTTTFPRVNWVTLGHEGNPAFRPISSAASLLLRHKGSREKDGAVMMPEFQDAMNKELVKRGYLMPKELPLTPAEIVRGLQKGSDKARFSVCVVKGVEIAIRADSGHTGGKVDTGAGVDLTSADAPLAWHLTWGTNKDSILKSGLDPARRGRLPQDKKVRFTEAEDTLTHDNRHPTMNLQPYVEVDVAKAEALGCSFVQYPSNAVCCKQLIPP